MYPYTIFDIEANGLYWKATKIYCFSYTEFDESGKEIASGTLTDYQEIRDYIARGTTLIGHNIIRYDVPILEKILGITVTNLLIDTLSISWYLYPNHKRHSLEIWGERLGVKKVEIEDWENLTLLQYIERCEVDVLINKRLFRRQIAHLQKLYDKNDTLLNLLKYLSFKMDCLKDQELEGIMLDEELALESIEKLNAIIDEKVSTLTSAMPYYLGRVEKTRPKVMYKKDGSLSYYGKKWVALLEERNLPEDTEEVYEEPNPNSHTQLKQWLYELGWNPITWKTSKNTGEDVPQITLPFGGGICPSVKKLYEIEPALEEIEGLAVARHRLAIFEGYLKHKDHRGRISSVAHGFTNTLRLRHASPIVNLPGVYKPWGEEVRGSLVVPSSKYVMCGSDISGLEDSTKRHYMYYFDPDYVAEMSVPGFDGHIDIALFAGLMSKEDADFFKEVSAMSKERFTALTDLEKRHYTTLKQIRTEAKVINFAGVYGVGPPKLAKQMGKSLEEATTLHTAYWERNIAVKKVAENTKVKLVGNQLWLLNPISGFYLYLKEEKDKFSTLNQSSGVYVFDTWLKNVRKKFKPLGITIPFQYHDELMFCCRKELQDIANRLLQEAMDEANAELQLNVTIKIDTAWGINYAECH
jgi:hypothetical protein